ncbi:MAG: hypothetical protein JNL71_08645 [Rhodospirillales bacterium]|nr:hypothetical protein [Rhodospirillales bacterium]
MTFWRSTMILRAVFAVLALASAAVPAAAEDPRPNSSPPKVNKDADSINASNPRVFHAGPGKPLQGNVWTPPSAAAAVKKDDKGAAK